jgi:hypothetical protein
MHVCTWGGERVDAIMLFVKCLRVPLGVFVLCIVALSVYEWVAKRNSVEGE